MRVTYSSQALETWAGTVYLQSMIMVRVSLSLASWKGGWPHTNMNRITPRLQMSEAQERETESRQGFGQAVVQSINLTLGAIRNIHEGDMYRDANRFE